MHDDYKVTGSITPGWTPLRGGPQVYKRELDTTDYSGYRTYCLRVADYEQAFYAPSFGQALRYLESAVGRDQLSDYVRAGHEIEIVSIDPPYPNITP